MVGKALGEIERLLACPDDHSELTRDETGYICLKCKKVYPVTNNIANFLSYGTENAVYDIPWHPVPSKSVFNAIKSQIRRLPTYWRLLITSDHFSLALERIIYRSMKERHAIIDIGCREGFNLMFVSGKGICVGVDIDFKSVQYANEMTPKKSHALLASGTALPFREGSFDCIICTDVIEHVEDFPKLVREISRIGRRDGCSVVLTTPDGDVVPKPYELHHRHFRRNELQELLVSEFPKIAIRSIVRNCRPKKAKWWFVNRYGDKFRFLYLIINTITNIIYYLYGYHREDQSKRDDITDSTFIVVASR